MKRTFLAGKSSQQNNLIPEESLPSSLIEVLGAFYDRNFCKLPKTETTMHDIDHLNQVRKVTGGRQLTKKEIKSLLTH